MRWSPVIEWARSRRRRTTFAIGLAAVLVYEAARAWCRPFIYSRAIDDVHPADTLGNSLGTIATVMVFASLFGRTPAQGTFVLRASAIAVAGRNDTLFCDETATAMPACPAPA